MVTVPPAWHTCSDAHVSLMTHTYMYSIAIAIGTGTLTHSTVCKLRGLHKLHELPVGCLYNICGQPLTTSFSHHTNARSHKSYTLPNRAHLSAFLRLFQIPLLLSSLVSFEEDSHAFCILVNLVPVVKLVEKRSHHRSALGRGELSRPECPRRFSLRALCDQHAHVPTLAQRLLDRLKRDRNRVPLIR